MVACGLQAVDHSQDVIRGPILAELGLRLDPIDDHLDTDDRPKLTFDVRRRRIVNRPRFGARRFVAVNQGTHVPLAPGRVVVHDELTVEMRRDVIPRRDDPAVFTLRRVPAR